MIDKTLNKNQALAVNNKNGPLLIVAGAGSGKTKTLTNRIIKLLNDGVEPNKILAITFTNKAADEMRQRVLQKWKDKTLKQPPFIGTFHSLGAKILRQEAKFFKRTANFSIYDDNDSFSVIKKVVKNLNLSKDKQKYTLYQYLISKAKSTLNYPQNGLEQKIFQDYERILEKNNAFDLDDLIEKPVQLLQSSRQVLQKYHQQYLYILIDEFQDTNAAQYLLVKMLAQNHKNINAVGDDAQSIYGWRHADFRLFLNFEKDWPGAMLVFLEENFRSTGNILAAANSLIKHNKIQKPKNLWTKNDAGEKIHVIAADTEEEEAEKVADLISNLPVKLSDIAILYRTNAQSRAIEQALIYQQIPYCVFGGIKFYERKEIKDITAALRIAANKKDDLALERLKKSFYKKDALCLIEELPYLSRKLTPAELINFIINNSNYDCYLEKNFPNYQERLDNIEELKKFASSFDSLEKLLEQISLAQAQDQIKSKEGVNLMTIHLAKGLEFNTVFIIGCTEGILPHQRSLSTLSELEEERRLMYVAITRAKKNLYLTFHSLPSRFLYEISPDLIEFDSASPHYSALEEEDNWIEYN